MKLSPARIANIFVKVALVGLLVYGALNQDMSQFQGNGMTTRVWAFSLPALIIPFVWLCLGRERRARWPYPDLTDIFLVLPFLLDTAGNSANLYDSITWFDDAMHMITWIPWVIAFGLLLHYAPRANEIPRWAFFGVVVGFGAVTHIIWELLEYIIFIRFSDELATAYTDTLGDLTMSLGGTIIGAILIVTVLWKLGVKQSTPIDQTSSGS